MKSNSLFNSIFIGLLALIITSSFKQQPKWELQKNKDSIKVYTRDVAHIGLKEVMVTFEVNSTPNKIAQAVTDSKIHIEWMEDLEESKLLEKRNENEYFYYLEFDFPWPANNRDVISHTKTYKDTNHIVTKIITKSISDFMPKKAGIVRIIQYDGTWEFKTLASGKTEVVHFLLASPGGELPDWIVNMFLIDQPFTSHKRLKNYLEK